MHDLDRTRAEYETGLEAMETGFEFQGEGEFSGETYEFAGESAEGETGLNEMQETELAAELLEIANEEELNQFLGKLISKVGKAAGSFVRSPVGQALGGILKQAAKKALPIAGAALGNLIVPGVGGAIGGQLASKAGSFFGLELEGLSQEDREFEVARRFVRLGAAATRNAMRFQPRRPYQRRMHPSRAARLAFNAAARHLAPGFVTTPVPAPIAPPDVAPIPVDDRPPCTCGAADPDATNQEYLYSTPETGRAGRWYRRGSRIVLVGI